MTASRITTRAGRKIRHVAPGHVVDVATGVDLQRRSRGGTWAVVYPPCLERWRSQHRLSSDHQVDGLLTHVARAEAACALVRVLVAIGGRP